MGGGKKGKSTAELKLKNRSTIVIMSKKPLLHRHYEGEDYKDACIKCMLAYVNWGPDAGMFESPAARSVGRNVRMRGMGLAQRRSSRI